MSKSKLTLKPALFLGAASLAMCAFAGAALAQEATETVVVTGSRIASPDAVAAAPLTVVSAADISQTKAATLEQTINRLPSMTQTNSSNDQNSISPGGISTADLRGLGTERTLVLIDGQRMVSTFVSGAQGQDLQNIPVGLIDRVEILRDGASPIYGADAIAGVINIITKKDFQGLQLSGGAGISTHGDHATKQLSALLGAQTANAGVIAGIQYTTEDPVRQGARTWAGGGDGSANLYSYSSAVPLGRFQDTVTKQIYCGNASNTLTPATSCGLFNTANDPDLIQGRSVLNANLQAHYDINDHLTVYTSSFFTNRKSDAVLNPEPVGDVYPSAKWLSGIVIPASNPNNPTGHDLALRKRLYEVGDRVFDDNVNTFQERVGVKGDLAGWHFDAGYQYGESDSSDYTHGAVNLTHIQEMVGAIPCEPGAPAGCGGVMMAGLNSLTPDQAKYAQYVGMDNSRYAQNIAYLDVTGSLPFGLPAGNIGVAVGGDWRREGVQAIPDALKQTGDFAEGTSLPTQGHYDVSEVYGELSIPLLKDAPLAEDLSIDLAGRISQYSNFGNANVYKGSFNWQVNDVVRLRGGYGTGVRAPQVGGELYLGANQSADGFSDPCVGPTDATTIANCRTAIGPTYDPATFTQAVPQLSAARVGNPNLKPETSNQWNLGAVITLDQFVPGLSATVDYYNIHINNYITLIDPGSAVSLCYGSVGFSDPNCPNIGTRNAVNGALTSYTEPYTNLGYIRTDGVDMGATWNTTDPIGALEGWGLGLSTQWTYLNNYKQQNLDGTVTQYAGTYSEGAISYGQPKWKGLFSARLSMPDAGPSFELVERFIGQTYVNDIYGETPDEPGYNVPALVFTDININVPVENYDFNFGVDNLLDKDPPIALDPYVQSLSNQYDFVGRFFYLRGTVNF
ncbi:MAG: TonB-dependent receptor [Alphaproteobacteria bacterium]|nr:TonB-dependent receptor [Alphaproteobacteria bacterium]